MKLTTRSIKQYLKRKGIELDEMADLQIDQIVHGMGQLVELRQKIEDEGPILVNKTSHGTTHIKHPAITAYKEYTNLLLQWFKEFGLTPKSSKELLKGIEPVKKSGFDLARKAS